MNKYKPFLNRVHIQELEDHFREKFNEQYIGSWYFIFDDGAGTMVVITDQDIYVDFTEAHLVKKHFVVSEEAGIYLGSLREFHRESKSPEEADAQAARVKWDVIRNGQRLDILQ